jgi:hypothetical protein
MKSLAKVVLIGIIAIVVIFFCQWNRHSKNVNLAQTAAVLPTTPVETRELVSSPKAIIDRSPVMIRPAPLPRQPTPFEDEIALIHSKLHKWLEAKKNGTEEDETQSMVDLQAMLTDTNAAEIMQSLSADELDTPFGFEGIRHWMNADPVQASNWFAARPTTTQDQTGAIAQGWAANSAGLQNYVAQLPDTTWKQSFLQEAGSQMSVKDPAVAVKLAQQMTPGNDQTSLLQSVACNWAANDPNAALDWIASVKDPSLRELLAASAAQSYALTDPALATAWLVSMAQSDAVVKDATLNIIQTWVTKDPASAANWASQLPDGDTKLAAIDTVSKYWEQTDPNAAATWILTLAEAPAASAN